jgi:hypothetical protein
VQGIAQAITPSGGNHGVCYCDDCQAFAHFLGRADEILDASGGTDIFQMSPAKVRFTTGLDRLACMRLTRKGLLRWYASCCNTPIGNTLPTAQIPFISLIRPFIAPPGDVSASAALGPVRARVFERFATGDKGAIPKGGPPLWRVLLRVLRLMLTWRLRGDHWRSPLFDATTGLPIAAPRVLSETERAALGPR